MRSRRGGGRTAWSQIGNVNDNRQAREKAEQANDRARVGNVNRQERRDRWAGGVWGYRGMPRWINGKQRKAKSAIFMLMNIIFLCLLSLLRKVSQINSLKWHFSILMMSPRLRLQLSPTVWQLSPALCWGIMNSTCSPWEMNAPWSSRPNPNPARPTELNSTELSWTEPNSGQTVRELQSILRLNAALITELLFIIYRLLLATIIISACLPAWSIARLFGTTAMWREGREEGKRGRKDGWKVYAFG